MNSVNVIPTNFYIPPWTMGYRWIFVAGPYRANIRAHGPRTIEIEHWHLGKCGKYIKPPAKVENLELDWIEEAISDLRKLSSSGYFSEGK